ncbi:MAG TPA: hypothetical protein DEB06_00710, partial [Phycisphaerales bacterium]|nr:hypothetical protein [Phycisphaerales bacterium]
SPFAYYLGSLAMRAAGRGAEHEEFARRLRALAPSSAAAGWVSGPPTLTPRVHVLFESGVAPRREPVTQTIAGFDILPLPRLVVDDRDRPAALRLVTEDGSFTTERLASIDALVATDFNDRLWELWGRPILATLLKVGAAEAAA